MEGCIKEIRSWMAENFLKLNDDKTEFLIIGSKSQLKKVKTSTIQIGTSVISSTSSARNIGAMFDDKFTFGPHIEAVCKSARYQLRNIGKIRKFLNTETTAMLIHAFVTSRLDNLNGLLCGMPSVKLAKLQKIQNNAARLLTTSSKWDSITPILRDLHWLPIPERIHFKTLLLTYKALNGEGPAYLRELLELYNPTRSLRSSDKLLLVEPRSRFQSYGDRSFSVTAPVLWNKLPLSIRQCPTTTSFKSKLKKHLFDTKLGNHGCQ